MGSTTDWTAEIQSLSNRPPTVISSVGGFSQSTVGRITTLQDLLRTLQPLKLKRYEGAQLQENRILGEGASYRVFGSKDLQSGSLLAVKKVKLPDAPSNLTAFQSRIGCVLKDIEVMGHVPLAGHPNILNLLGYGWQSTGLDVIPFVVTEYATHGNLREYLTKNYTTARTRRRLCYQVSSGLHGLHLSGVAHGDLKLENVLVTVPVLDIEADHGMPVVAKLCDFGHSVCFTPGTDRGEQTYHGTLWYNSPETLQQDRVDKTINARKCDMWALGLLCWETLRQGVRYYEDLHIQGLLTESRALHGLDSQDSQNFDPRHGSAKTSSQMVLSISHLLGEEAHKWVDQSLRNNSEWSHFDKLMLKGIFKNTLRVEVSKRFENVSHLPLIFDERKLHKSAAKPAILEQSASGPEWSIMPFFPDQMSQTPIKVKREILADLERRAALPLSPDQSPSRAALSVVFAHGARFTDQKQHQEHLRSLVRKSAQDGSLIATHMGDLIARTLCEQNAAPTTPEAYTLALRATIKALARSEYASLIGLGQRPTFASILIAAREQNVSTLVAHYAVIYQVVQDLPPRYLNIRNPATGETALALACRLGDHKAAQQLVQLGADPSICTFDNSSPLHWLFMFDDDCIPTIDLNYHDAINMISGRPIVLDAQLPADFQDSPLSFAIAAASKAAVYTILSGRYELKPSTLAQAWRLASSLHLHVILKRLPISIEQDSSFRLGFNDISRSSPAITKLIHGSNLEAARSLTVKELFSRHYSSTVVDFGGEANIEKRSMKKWFAEKRYEKVGSIGSENTLTASILLGLNSAIQAREITIAHNIIQQVVAKFPGQGFIAGGCLGAALSRICVQVACGLTYDIHVSFEILEFSFAHCGALNFPFSWFNAVITAIKRHRQDIFNWLMDKPHDLMQLNSQTHRGDTILHTALAHGFTKSFPIKHMLYRGADPKIVNMLGLTPLELATQLGAIEEVDCLLQHANAVRLYHVDCQTPFHSAVLCRSLPLLSKFLRHPVLSLMKDHSDKNGRTPLALATTEGFVEGVKLLLKANVSRAIFDKRKRTPYHLAVAGNSSSDFDILRILLCQPVGLNSIDGDGNTALHLAITSQASLRYPHWEICNDIIKAGIDLNIANKQGDLPFTLALRLCKDHSFSLLLPCLLGLEAESHLCIHNTEGQLETQRLYKEKKAAIAINMIQAHQNLHTPVARQRLFMRCLQATFNHAVTFQMATISRYFLVSRIPVDKSILCQPDYASVLASAIFRLQKDIIKCYEEDQSISSLMSLEQIPDSGSRNGKDFSYPCERRKSLWATMTPQTIDEIDRLLIVQCVGDRFCSDLHPITDMEGFSSLPVNISPSQAMELWEEHQKFRSRSKTSPRDGILMYHWTFRETRRVIRQYPLKVSQYHPVSQMNMSRAHVEDGLADLFRSGFIGKVSSYEVPSPSESTRLGTTQEKERTQVKEREIRWVRKRDEGGKRTDKEDLVEGGWSSMLNIQRLSWKTESGHVSLQRKDAKPLPLSFNWGGTIHRYGEVSHEQWRDG